VSKLGKEKKKELKKNDNDQGKRKKRVNPPFERGEKDIPALTLQRKGDQGWGGKERKRKRKAQALCWEGGRKGCKCCPQIKRRGQREGEGISVTSNRGKKGELYP